MNLARKGNIWPLRLLVLLLMLGAQSFSLAHELSHGPEVDNGVFCEVCSAGHGLDTGVQVAQVAPITASTHLLLCREVPAHHEQAATSHYIARAPPLNS